MKKRFFTIAMLSLLIICLVQLTVYALNNAGHGEQPYMWWLFSGVWRWADDVDGPLKSGAETDAWSILDPDTGEAGVFICYAWAWVDYSEEDGDDNPRYYGEYEVKVETLDFPKRTQRRLSR